MSTPHHDSTTVCKPKRLGDKNLPRPPPSFRVRLLNINKPQV